MNSADSTAEAAEAEPDVEAAPGIDDALVRSIIRTHAYGAAAGGLIPIPAVDIAVSTAAQIRMISRLGDVYGITFSQQAVKAAISSLVATVAPPALVGYPILSLAKSVPLLGQALGIATLPAINGVVTWALGRAFAWHFARGGTLENLNPKDLAARFRADLKAGKAAMSPASEDEPAPS